MSESCTDENAFETRVCAHMRAISGMSERELLNIRSTFDDEEPEYQPAYRAALDRAIRNIGTEQIP